MIDRRGFLKALFGASLGAVTRGVGDVVEALATRKIANQALSIVTLTHICDAKFCIIPYIELMKPVYVEGGLHGEGRLT